MKDIERMVISAHEDGEVESPWKEKVADKLASDAEWAAEADRHRRVKTALARDAEPDFSSSLDKVRSRLEGTSVTRRVNRLPILLTAAAAALLMLAAGGGFWLGRQGPSGGVAEITVQVPKQLPLKLSGEGQLLMASTVQGIRR